jgi:hypothetical protein
VWEQTSGPDRSIAQWLSIIHLRWQLFTPLLLHLFQRPVEAAPPSLSAPAQRSALADALADALAAILQLWRRGALILDEVDLHLHPLRSEFAHSQDCPFPTHHNCRVLWQ